MVKQLHRFLRTNEFKGKQELFKLLNHLDDNTRSYDKVAFGAKYGDIELSYHEVLDIEVQYLRLKKWMRYYGEEVSSGILRKDTDKFQ